MITRPEGRLNFHYAHLGVWEEPGSVGYLVDHHGHVLKGRAYPNMNSMAFFVYGPGPRDFDCVSAGQILFEHPGARKVRVYDWKYRMEGILKKAVDRQDFEKAIIIRDILARESEKAKVAA